MARLTSVLGQFLGQNTEVVLHDLRQPERSIVAIKNEELTGRQVGDTIEALGLHLFEQHGFEDMVNYETRTKSGKLLRSCSVFVRDDAGQAIGALCVNQDLSALLRVRDWLDQSLPGYSRKPESEATESKVEDLLSELIEDAIRASGKQPENLTRDDKIAVIRYLEARGAFLIRYSMEKVAALLGISKYSIYNYLGDKKDLESAAANSEGRA